MARIRRVKYWEIIADRLSKAGWSWGCVATIDSNGRTIWIVDAHRDDVNAVISARIRTEIWNKPRSYLKNFDPSSIASSFNGTAMRSPIEEQCLAPREALAIRVQD